MIHDSAPGGRGLDGVAVVVPYFQRRPGILAHALRSVFAQDPARPPRVVVVDDASPAPAAAEVAVLPDAQRARVTLLGQANSGPGAARNRALDNLPPGTRYVAFLDSDDQWCPGHLPRAVAALERGYDFYFSNYLDIGADVGGFETRGHLSGADHDALAGVPGVYAYRGDLRDAVLSRCPIETSTVVYRRSAFASVRFRAFLRNAYEDYLFWFELAAASSRVVFGTEVGTRYGEGINLYRGASADPAAAFRVVVGSTRFRAAVRAEYDLTPHQRDLIAERLRLDREAVAAHAMHCLRRFKLLPWKDLMNYMRADPRSCYLLPATLFKRSLAWAAGRRDTET